MHVMRNSRLIFDQLDSDTADIGSRVSTALDKMAFGVFVKKKKFGLKKQLVRLI